MNITAAWLPDPWAYRLEAAAAVGSPTWYRSAYWPDGRYSNQGLGTGATMLDHAVPLDGATITYTAVDGSDVAEIAVTPPQPPKPVLSLTGSTQPAALVAVESLREQTVAGRGAFYEVLDRNEPYVETMRPTDRSGQMTLRVPHDGGSFPGQTLDRLRKMLRTGGRMTLRTTCNDRVESLFFVFLTWTESQIGSENQHGPDRRIVIDWRAVDPMWGDLTEVGRVWAMVPKEFATWTDVVANVPTWEALVSGGGGE